jgi:hypothetical protein
VLVVGGRQPIVTKRVTDLIARVGDRFEVRAVHVGERIDVKGD